MSERLILQQKVDACHKRWQDLSKKIEPLQKQMDLETRVDEQLRLKEIIEQAESDRQEVEDELKELRREFDKLSKQDLIRDALRMERNRAFAEAAKIWEQVRDSDPEDTRAGTEIERLSVRRQEAEVAAALIKRLSQRIVEIKPVFARVTRTLQQLTDMGSVEETPLIAVVESFLASKITAEDFIDMWRDLEAGSHEENDEGFDFEALAHRLNRGEIVLFLGSDVPHLSGVDVPNPGSIAVELANQVNFDDFSGSLSTIAEYYQIRPEYGRRSLEARLQELLPSGPPVPSIYQMLAGIREPLVLISSAYDSLLEGALREAGKKFALISAQTSSVSDASVGKILLHYSDRDAPEAACLEQELSGHRLLDGDYSVIYKIRGYCPAPGGNGDGEHPELTLSEANYFAFARHIDKVIPSYLSKQFIGRGLLFLGYRPSDWEDRLIVNAILEKRLNSAEPSNVIGGGEDRFAAAYWESRKVRRHSLELNEFVSKLQEYL